MKTLAPTFGSVVANTAPFAGLTFNRILTALAVAKERRTLRDLSPAQLRDMGIDPVAAEIEAARSFWDLPAGR